MVPPKLEPVKLPEIAKKNIESICENGKCLGQKQEFKEQRAVVVKQEQAVELKLNPGKSVVQVQHEVERRVSKTFQLKREILKSAGLEDKVEPANNGVFQADLLLTEEQANSLIIELQKQMSQKLSNSITKHKTKRAGNAVFMESSPSQRWPLGVPIQYLFDQNIAINEQNAVKEALSEIQSKTCLQFIEAKTKPTGAHLYYTKVANPTFCGLSYVGQILPANPIYLSFMCGNGSGIALHETLHALGFQHEQLRFDRDQFITIQWENVNPQQFLFISYGLRYDYGSIMHYSDTIAAQSPGKKTMTAKLAPFLNDPIMGQRKGLSASDIEALNKMYCMPGCEDKLVYCGIWASNNLCNPQMWRRVVVYEWIISNCQKSCNKCGEKLEPVKNRPF
uniref:Metalloendopeptidase n=2 Tax=Meloidogyne TaxID=189290 RepID=A0A914M968_MELIC